MSAVETGQKVDALSSIHNADCAASIWSRRLNDDTKDWLDALDPDDLPKGRKIVEIGDIADALSEMCDGLKLIEPEKADWLITDASRLAEQFGRDMSTDFVRLKFNVVNTNSCWKWHKDWIKARLVCTYRGTGTQYGIGRHGGEPVGGDISTLTLGAPIVLRGSLWPEHPDSGLLHRSPPIVGTGETRLLFVVDVVDDPNEE